MGVKVRERKPGEWWIFINHKRTRKAVKVGSREAAKAAAKKIEEGLITGKLKIGVSTVTFGEYAKKWMEGHVATSRNPRSGDTGASLIRTSFQSFVVGSLLRSRGRRSRNCASRRCGRGG